MSKVIIKNVSKSKSPLSCDLKDKTSLRLQYGQSVSIEESLLTDYLNRRITEGDYKITKVKETEKPKTTKNVGTAKKSSNQ